MNTKEFIEKAKSVHGDKYDYIKTIYINPKEKICIICPTHGEFWIRPYNHLNGQGCGKCRYEALSNKYKKTTEQWIEEAKAVHGDKYDYSKVEYNLCQDKVYIICPKHGGFWQRPLSHIRGQGCPHCYNESKIGKYILGNEKFIEKARKVHGDKYDYSKVEYKSRRANVCIICPIHGEFWQRPHNHVNEKQGCPKCNKSKLENKISLILEKNCIEFEEQKKFDWLGNFELDFYLPKYNIAIECQGIQHFKPVARFGGEKRYNEQIEWDNKKRKLCEENGVNVLYFSNDTVMKQNDGYFPYDVIISEEKLMEKIK